MRRKFNSFKFVSFILLIAIFTLSSYFFDQMVIRMEDDLRNLKIKLENKNVKINNINSTYSQLDAVSTFARTRFIALSKFRNYWYKNIVLLLSDEKNLQKDKNEFLKNFVSSNFAIYSSKIRFLDFYDNSVITHNSIRERLFNIYAWNASELFPEYINKDGYIIYEEVEFDKVFNEITQIKDRNFSKYASIVFDEEKYDYAIDNFNLSDWSDLHKYTYNLINKLKFYDEFIKKDLLKLEKLVLIDENDRDSLVLDISKTNSIKNYCILISIISQILSLFFLLFLFRSLLLSNKKL